MFPPKNGLSNVPRGTLETIGWLYPKRSFEKNTPRLTLRGVLCRQHKARSEIEHSVPALR